MKMSIYDDIPEYALWFDCWLLNGKYFMNRYLGWEQENYENYGRDKAIAIFTNAMILLFSEI